MVMKGPEEREQLSHCSPEWLIEKSRQALESGDQFSAKSWLLTAKTLHPRSFLIQYEAFLIERRTGQLLPCGKLFLEMIKSFSKEEILWKELKQIVKSQELNEADLDTESRFLKDMYESLPINYQRELLLKYADHQTDLIEKCQISLVVMKKFQGATKQYGLKLTELLMKAESAEGMLSPLNVYRKLLVCDVVPFVLQSPEIQVDTSHKHKLQMNTVYVAEATVLKWLELSMEYFVTCRLEQNHLNHSHPGSCHNRAGEDMLGNEVILLHCQPQMLFDHLLLFATKCGWSNILKVKDKVDPDKNKNIKNRWKVLCNMKESIHQFGSFYCILELFFFAIIEYCSRLTNSSKGQRDGDNLEFMLLDYFDDSNTTHSSQHLSSPSKIPRKKRRLNDGSASLAAASVDSHSAIDEFQSIAGQINSLIDYLHVAVETKRYIEANSAFSKEFGRILSDWKVKHWDLMEIFETDSLIYQAKYRELIDLLKEKDVQVNDNDSIKTKKRNTKHLTQLAMSLFSQGEKKEACHVALDAICAISDSVTKETRSTAGNNTTTITKITADGRCFQLLACSQNHIMAFGIKMIIHCLKEKLSSVDLRPDQDKIKPIYDIRQDDVIGHLIVLMQFDWPKEEASFQQLVKTIVTLGGLKYEKFFKYVTNIDILEEFSYLNNLEKFQLEVQESNTSESSRKTVTRGVNRENKEDFRAAMDLQLERCDGQIEHLILTFLQNERSNFLGR